jgi:hypothetical protein
VLPAVVEKSDAAFLDSCTIWTGGLLVFSVAQAMPAHAQHGNLITMFAEVSYRGSSACYTSFIVQQI